LFRGCPLIDRSAAFAYTGSELVSHSGHSNDETRLLRIELDLAPQSPNHHVHAAVVNVIWVARRRTKQLAPRQYSALTAGKGCDERKFAAAEGHFLSACIGERMAFDVKREPIKHPELALVDDTGVTAVPKLKDRPYARQNFASREWLSDADVDFDPQPSKPIRHLRLVRHDDQPTDRMSHLACDVLKSTVECCGCKDGQINAAGGANLNCPTGGLR